MKNDSISGLRIRQIIAVLIILVLMGTSTQILVFNKKSNEIKLSATKETENKELDLINDEEMLQIASQRSIVNRTFLVTNRGSIDRNYKEEIEEPKYITIDEIKISRDMDLTVRCGISKEDFVLLMKNLKVDRSGFFYENSETIYELCEQYEINEIFFCGLIAGESGWGIANNHRNTCNYISMMSNGRLIRYSNPREGLEAAAKLLHKSYLTEGGSYYCGKTLSGVQKRFCPGSSTWVGLIYGCMKQIIK